MRALRIFAALAMLISFTVNYADILKVGLDGTHPFTSIQTAIDVSADGDTVLVYPGRYYENVAFNGKNITLASLELITGDRDYVYSTIVDANHSGVGISTTSGESNIVVRGFTITNGSGRYNSTHDITLGGGIIASHMIGQKAFSIINCVITGNRATNGGGFWGGACDLTLSGVSMYNNIASTGGGIFFDGGVGGTIYDPINRCSIYSNYAAVGSDMYYYNANSVHVVVDTFTVANPWNFYASAIPRNPNIHNPFTFDILNTVHEEVNHDLYVATWGDDANSGLSPDTPMRSIFGAMYRIASDENDPKTVYVADGRYSPSLNNQLFPLPVKSHTRLIGESREGTILDLEYPQNRIAVAPRSVGFTISNLTIINGGSGIRYSYTTDSKISNVTIDNMSDIRSASGIYSYMCYGKNEISDVTISNVYSIHSATGLKIFQLSGSVNLYNVDVSNVSSHEWLPILQVETRGECDVILDRCSLSNSFKHSSATPGSVFEIVPYDDYATRLRIEVRNSAFYDNYQGRPIQVGAFKSLNDSIFVDNCTIAGNIGCGPALLLRGTSVLTNNIFYNPSMYTQISASHSYSLGIYSHTTLHNNNILGGSDAVYSASSQNVFVWGDNNTSYDPLFSLEGNRPYTLSMYSPLIDTGKQPASGLAAPGLDAGGNERLWDGDGDGVAIIDVGAYEYQPIYIPKNLSASIWQGQVLLSWEMPASDRGLSGYRVYRDHLPHADIHGEGSTYFREQISEADTLVYEVAALYGSVESAKSDSVVVVITPVDISDALAPAVPGLAIKPNPFSAKTRIHYSLPKQLKVEMSVYNLRGQKVRSLENMIKSSGEHILAWDGRDDNAVAVGSGIYLLRFEADGFPIKLQKMMLMK